MEGQLLLAKLESHEEPSHRAWRSSQRNLGENWKAASQELHHIDHFTKAMAGLGDSKTTGK